MFKVKNLFQSYFGSFLLLTLDTFSHCGHILVMFKFNNKDTKKSLRTLF